MRRSAAFLVLLLAAPLAAEEEKATLPAALVERLDAAIARGIVDEDIAPLYRACHLAGAELDAVVAHLDGLAADEEQAASRRTAARWTAGRLLARRGDRHAALGRIRAVAVETKSLPARLEEARLLDRLTRTRETRAAYHALLEAPLDEATATRLRLRLALLGGNGDDEAAKALVSFAAEAGREVDLRNRSAIVLALLDRPKEALGLFVARGEGKARFRQEVRRAEWALAAEDRAGARTHAWAALRAAEVRRDRRYALTLLVQAHRDGDDGLMTLIDRFEATPDLDADSRRAWIGLLRETGQAEEALRLFREAAEGGFTPAMRRELLEICREAGRDELLVSAYREIIEDQPTVLEWREGLARHFLERGDRDAAIAVWRPLLPARLRLAAARSLREIGLDVTAAAAAEQALREDPTALHALLFLYDLHRSRGRMKEAEEALARLDREAPADAPVRKELGEAFERLGRPPDAVRVLEGLREALGTENAAEDLDMRLAWLHSEVGNEEEALRLWRELWPRVESLARRRYVEDRMLGAASRLGQLADIAIELEEKLAEGKASAKESGLLVRLYTKANDSVSAAEIIEETRRQTGGDRVKALVEKGRAFLACTDYHAYEETIRELIEIDPEGRGDYLRQLAMSQLERGKPDEAREVLAELREIESGADGAEFEAGVLALAGLRDQAIDVYRRGLAHHPDRIESFLLLGNLLRDVGRADRAVGMFQHLAETASQDDLFTVAVDGLLNLEAPPAVLRWARRITLERLARRHDKMYLYQLLADLSDEIGDRDAQRRALESALPIAGEQRLTLLRELMDLTRGRSADEEKHLAYGRRLLGLGEAAPPQVYLDLGETFLRHDEVSNAAKTFALATEVPDWAAFQRQVAESFERADYPEPALRTYERLLVSRPGDVALMAKVGEIHERLGRDGHARELYGRALDLMLARRPSGAAKVEEEPRTPYSWLRNRNVDDYDQHYARVLTSLLAVLPPAEAGDLLVRQRALLEQDLVRLREAAGDEADGDLDLVPRARDRASFVRRLAFAFGRPDVADEVDRRLLQSFPKDENLLEALVQERTGFGLVASARALIEASGRDEEQRVRAGWLVGSAGAAREDGVLPPGEAVRLVLPLLADGDREALRDLLRRVDLKETASGDLTSMPLLLAAAFELEDGDAALRLARATLTGAIVHDKSPMSTYTVGRTVHRIGAFLDEERHRSLCDQVVTLVIEHPGSGGRWLSLIPQMQSSFEEPLLDADRIDRLLETLDQAGWVWMGRLFEVLPPEERSRTLRALLPKVAPTQRVRFVLELVARLDEEVDEDFAGLLVEAFRQGLGEVDRNDRFALIGLARAHEHGGNVEVKLRVAAAAHEAMPDHALARACHAVLLHRAGRTEEGLETALELWTELLTMTTTSDWSKTRARSLVVEVFLEDHLDRFLAALDEQAGEGGSPLALTQRRLELVTRARDPDALLAALRKAVEDHPEESGFLARLQSELSRRGLVREALEMLERLAESDPDNVYHRRRLVSTWRRLRHPIKALASKRRADEAPGARGRPRIRRPHVTIREVKTAVDEADAAGALRSWRRLWRGFRVGLPTTRIYYSTSMPRRLVWPPDPRPAGEARPSRGGLSDFRREPAARSEPRNAYEVIAEQPWGEDEIRRQVRTWTGLQVGSAPPIVDALVRVGVERRGADGLLGEILDAVREGRAGTLDYAMLLALVESQPDAIGEGAETVLADLGRTLRPEQMGQIRRLARCHARRGDGGRAARLYRWCGTQAAAGPIGFGGGAIPYVNAQDLVDEVAETLEGDLRDATVAEILRLAEPIASPPFGRVQRDPHDWMVLRTWEKILGPEDALARTRDLCESLMSPKGGLRRSAAKHAAALWARAGDYDRALACLEHGAVKLEMPDGLPAHMKYQYERSSLGWTDVRRLFPSETEGWADPVGWFLVASRGLQKWVDGEHLDGDRALPALAVLALRLREAEETAEAAAILERIRTIAGDDPRSLLWVVDVARLVGEDEEADAIERRLLGEGRLHVERVPEVLARIRAKDGDAAALALGEPLLEWTLHPDLLTLLLETARAAGDEERATRFEKLAAEAKAAETALEKE